MSEPQKRPMRRDDAVTRKAAEMLAPDVAEWIGEPADEEMIAGLAKALRRYHDGYELAGELERAWLISPDARLVEILDGNDLWGAERKLVAEWVTLTGAKAELPDGTMVKFSHGVGEITGRDEKQATYTIWNEDVKAERKPNCGWLIAAEDVTPITETEAAE